MRSPEKPSKPFSEVLAHTSSASDGSTAGNKYSLDAETLARLSAIRMRTSSTHSDACSAPSAMLLTGDSTPRGDGVQSKTDYAALRDQAGATIY